MLTLRLEKRCKMNSWSRIDALTKMRKYGVIPTVSGLKARDYLFVAEAIENAGLPITELCFRSGIPAKEILDAVYKLRSKTSKTDMLVGCGTINTPQLAQDAINAGAQFLASHFVDEKIIAVANENCILITPGARTELEVAIALRAGCLAVKILLPFGEEKHRLQFFKTISSLFPLTILFPTMGMTPENLGEYLKAGAPFVATSTPVIMPEEAVKKRDWNKIGEAAKKYSEAVQKARARA